MAVTSWRDRIMVTGGEVADWRELVDWVDAHYRVADRRMDDRGNPRFLKLVFELDEGRSQSVYLDYVDDDKSDGWVEISSPFASASSVNLEAVLEDMTHALCGGLALRYGLLFLKHEVSLSSLRGEILDRALEAVTVSADILEKHWGAGDSF